MDNIINKPNTQESEAQETSKTQNETKIIQDNGTPEKNKPNKQKKEKVYTIKSAKAEMEKCHQKILSNKAKITALTAANRALSAEYKELEIIYNKLYFGEMHKQVDVVWFKQNQTSNEVQGERLIKLLQIGQQIGDKLDNIDVKTAAEAFSIISDESTSSDTNSEKEINHNEKKDV